MEASAPPAGGILEPEREGPLRRAISRRMLLFFIYGRTAALDPSRLET